MAVPVWKGTRPTSIMVQVSAHRLSRTGKLTRSTVLVGQTRRVSLPSVVDACSEDPSLCTTARLKPPIRELAARFASYAPPCCRWRVVDLAFISGPLLPPRQRRRLNVKSAPAIGTRPEL
jgi:hypothetical protein